MAEVVKVTKEQLGINQGDLHEGPLQFDLGNLTAWDASAIDAAAFATAGTDATCHRLAQTIFQSLAARIFALPSEPAPEGRIAQLPRPTIVLPREKPIPKPRPPTKWEVFAQRKGIQKRKRSKLEWDETAQDWKRRYGYKKANDEAAVPVIEAKPGDQPGEDPFTKQRQEKKERVKTQQKQQLANLKAAAKAGATLPPTLKLAAALPEHGRGRPAKRKEFHEELKAASRQAAVSTASMGKFDRLAKGEKPEDRQPRGKKRKFAPVADQGGSEQQRVVKAVDRILAANADDIVDWDRAIGKYEAQAREERHRLKQKGLNKKGRLEKGGAPESGGKAAKGGGRKGSGGGGKATGGKAGGKAGGGKRRKGK